MILAQVHLLRDLVELILNFAPSRLVFRQPRVPVR
jgi:hypothetical protein